MDSLCGILRTALEDPDPYVRKTAALSVLKLYFHNRERAEQEGFVVSLKKLLSDSNPMVRLHDRLLFSQVVANALVALCEINRKSADFNLIIELGVASNLLAAMNECSE